MNHLKDPLTSRIRVRLTIDLVWLYVLGLGQGLAIDGIAMGGELAWLCVPALIISPLLAAVIVHSIWVRVQAATPEEE